MTDVRVLNLEFPYVLITCDIETRGEQPFSAFLYDGFTVSQYGTASDLCRQLRAETKKTKLVYVIDRYGTARERFARWLSQDGSESVIKVDDTPPGMDAHAVMSSGQAWLLVFFKSQTEVVIPTAAEHLTHDQVEALPCIEFFRDYIHSWTKHKVAEAYISMERAKADA